MIRRKRDRVAEPAALKKTYGKQSKAPKKPGLTEREAVVAAFEEHVRSGGNPANFKFKFERYQDDDVKKALRQLFGGKCAYCESDYAGTQPMDVEHWRPKSEVHDNGSVLPGYYWLASEWTNLLPSCIDCNRARTQFDVVEQREINLGKANQFPVTGKRLASPTDDHLGEMPLLLEPCENDPEAFLRYTEDGVVLPSKDAGEEYERAMASIRVYALNRSDLVSERLALRRIIDHRLNLIKQLGELRKKITRPKDQPLRDVVSDLIAGEIDALLAMTHDDQPYAGMVREIVRSADPKLPKV